MEQKELADALARASSDNSRRVAACGDGRQVLQAVVLPFLADVLGYAWDDPSIVEIDHGAAAAAVRRDGGVAFAVYAHHAGDGEGAERERRAAARRAERGDAPIFAVTNGYSWTWRWRGPTGEEEPQTWAQIFLDGDAAAANAAYLAPLCASGWNPRGVERICNDAALAAATTTALANLLAWPDDALVELVARHAGHEAPDADARETIRQAIRSASGAPGEDAEPAPPRRRRAPSELRISGGPEGGNGRTARSRYRAALDHLGSLPGGADAVRAAPGGRDAGDDTTDEKKWWVGGGAATPMNVRAPRMAEVINTAAAAAGSPMRAEVAGG